jgi:hypothetical protein
MLCHGDSKQEERASLNADARRELDALKAKAPNRVLTPQAVVTAARKKTSALHKYFTWSQKEAAEKYLLWEARKVITAYVTVEITSSGPVKTRGYVSLTTDRVNGGGYRAVSDVLSDDEMAQQMLDDALAELEVFSSKYRRVQQLRPVFDAIEEVVRKPSRKPKSRQAEARAA